MHITEIHHLLFWDRASDVQIRANDQGPHIIRPETAVLTGEDSDCRGSRHVSTFGLFILGRRRVLAKPDFRLPERDFQLHNEGRSSPSPRVVRGHDTIAI